MLDSVDWAKPSRGYLALAFQGFVSFIVCDKALGYLKTQSLAAEIFIFLICIITRNYMYTISLVIVFRHQLEISSFMQLNLKKVMPLLDQFVVSGSNFVLTILLARLLDVSDFGLYSVTWLIVISIASFLQAVIFAPMLSFSPKLTGAHRKYFFDVIFSELIYFLVLFLIIVTCVLGVSNYFEQNNTFKIAQGIILLSVPYYLFEFLRRYLMIIGKNTKLFFCDAINYFSILFGLYFLSNNELINTVLIVSVCFTTTSLIILLGSNFRLMNLFQRQSKYIDLITKQFAFSKWLAASSGLQFLNGNVFTLIAGTIVSISQVGYIKMAQNIVGIINPIYVFLDNHAQLYLAKVRYEQGVASCERAYLKIASLCMVGLVSLLLFIFLFKSEILTLLYGKESSVLSNYLSLMLLLSAITGANFLERLILKVRENTKIIFKAYLYSAIISCAVVYPLISMWEGLGAVQAMIVAQIVMLLVMLSAKRKIIK